MAERYLLTFFSFFGFQRPPKTAGQILNTYALKVVSPAKKWPFVSLNYKLFHCGTNVLQKGILTLMLIKQPGQNTRWEEKRYDTGSEIKL